MTTFTKPSELLINAKKLIENPNNWRQGTYFNDEYTTMEEATCFCSKGALCKSANVRIGTDTKFIPDFNDAVNYLEAKCDWNVPNFNDNNPHEVVMAAWDRAIAHALQDGK